MWERACSRMRIFIQHLRWLTHLIREQARSHMGCIPVRNWFIYGQFYTRAYRSKPPKFPSQSLVQTLNLIFGDRPSFLNFSKMPPVGTGNHAWNERFNSRQQAMLSAPLPGWIQLYFQEMPNGVEDHENPNLVFPPARSETGRSGHRHQLRTGRLRR
ncbi:hypothetical protein E1508_01835 [Pseudomonas moraviensis]|nr:hypothetical protein E1508_01835 [Pseudomonas moraviensis]